jgi:type I restriction enzyme M protein
MTDKLDLEKPLWQVAEYKHVVLGLTVLKFISYAFDELYEQLKVTEAIKINFSKIGYAH